ncbi:Nif11-like leader peptide family natural product precursor [Synechococcus sp. WH 8016]|uniref:Nif11-like leader peptide family natural product precursor n=1 Tax=Synechococcus sp. WH 8016 TaxID=166318 RepID=UPI00131F2EE2
MGSVINSPPNQLINFCAILSERNDLQSQIKEATTCEQIIAIAASNGYEISYKELRTWSKELKAPYFPWAEKGNEWRRNFFS